MITSVCYMGVEDENRDHMFFQMQFFSNHIEAGFYLLVTAKAMYAIAGKKRQRKLGQGSKVNFMLGLERIPWLVQSTVYDMERNPRHIEKVETQVMQATRDNPCLWDNNEREGYAVVFVWCKWCACVHVY